MNAILTGFFLFLFFSTSAFDMGNLRKDAYLECIMNSHERTILINGKIIHCGCGKFATSVKFEPMIVVGFCPDHTPKPEDEIIIKKEELFLSTKMEFPKPPEPIKKTESEK